QRDYGMRPVHESGSDGGRGAQNVDYRHGPARGVRSGQGVSAEEYVYLHLLNRKRQRPSNRSVSRSRNFVSTSPARNRGLAITRARNGMVVVTPSTTKASRATCMRPI